MSSASRTRLCSSNKFLQTSSLKEEASLFGDSSCGEPLLPQHLVVDFTPNDQDTEFVQKKCCAFWKFVNNCPEIRHFQVFPEKTESSEETNTKSDSSCSEFGPGKPIPLDKTAVSMLEIAEEEGLINRTFEAKLPRSTCTLGSREYKEGVKTTKKACSCVTACKCRLKSKADTHKLSQDMVAWDIKHPKSMEPPGHPPVLQRCVLQRLDEPPRPVNFDSML